MTLKELLKVIEHIDKYNGWRMTFQTQGENRKGKDEYPFIKYVNFSLDTRDNEIWHIKFRDKGGENKVFTHEDSNLENIMNYLQGKDSSHTIQNI